METKKLPAKERLQNAAEAIINNEGYYPSGSFLTRDDWGGLLDEEIPPIKTYDYDRYRDRRIKQKDKMNFLFATVYHVKIRLFSEDDGFKLLKGDAAISRFRIEEERKQIIAIKKTAEYAGQMKLAFTEVRQRKQLDYCIDKAKSTLEAARNIIQNQAPGMKKSVVSECMAMIESAQEYVINNV